MSEEERERRKPVSDLEELRERLRNHRPVPWGQLPDFALYMDQILSYMDRQVIRFQDEDPLTAAMVNNYTKSGLVPRAEGKKYGREHLAYLTTICILKRVMSTRDMDLLIRQELRGRQNVEDGYAAFCQSLDKALRITLREVEQREGLSPGPEPEQDGGTADRRADGEAGRTAVCTADEAADRTTDGTAVCTADNPPGTRGHSLADNAIHFALLSYAAGVASRRYVALLRKQYARSAGTQPSEKAAKREARSSARAARREAQASDKAARREAQASEKAARREAQRQERAGERRIPEPDKKGSDENA